MRAWPPVRRTKRRKSRKMHFQEFWDSCAQNKTAEISRNALSGILGLLCAEQDVGTLNKNCTFSNYGTPVRRTKRRKSKQMHVQEFWYSCAQNKTSDISTKYTFITYEAPVRRKKTTSEISTNALSRILGLLCADQNVGNLNKCTFRNSGTPVRRTKRRTSQQMRFQELWDSSAQSKTSDNFKMHFQQM